MITRNLTTCMLCIINWYWWGNSLITWMLCIINLQWQANYFYMYKLMFFLNFVKVWKYTSSQFLWYLIPTKILLHFMIFFSMKDREQMKQQYVLQFLTSLPQNSKANLITSTNETCILPCFEFSTKISSYGQQSLALRSRSII